MRTIAADVVAAWSVKFLLHSNTLYLTSPRLPVAHLMHYRTVDLHCWSVFVSYSALINIFWWFGVVVASFIAWTKLIYVLPDKGCVPPRYATKLTKSTQPCIHPESLNCVSSLIGWGKGRNITSAESQSIHWMHCVITYGMWVPVEASLSQTAIFCTFAFTVLSCKGLKQYLKYLRTIWFINIFSKTLCKPQSI